MLVIVAVMMLSRCGDSSNTQPQAFADTGSAIGAETTGARETLYVSGTSANCRSAPKSKGRKVARLSSGDEVTSLETDGSWTKVERSQGSDCWVSSRLLSTVKPAPPPPAPERIAARKRLSTKSSRQCGGKWKCGQMNSCAEAYHYLNTCGVGRLDGDGDGVPCESIC
ncbi:SH3 domain-containing protein [Sphingomonas sp. AOB5]|uniref:SH3 domain-containing protein n=1 Tax=Sphingomonas sp. AOB5 TaxID=3034017 RepID=UPI0023F6AA42|nr:SH3 domain-containing protein [Sphingomonas sp. AOB5]MDF7774277.1 SH3 domain-containing protein [Sphingomonas sp. AOB5]